jgi:hypothetical protein
MPRYPLLAVCLLFAVSCSSEAVLTGDVFVVTQNRDTVKLSGSFVYLAPMSPANLSKATEFENTGDLHTLKDLNILQVTNTDADGKFRFTAPRGQYFITVTESRGPVGNQEFFHWLVIAEIPGTVSLNNSNMRNLTP